MDNKQNLLSFQNSIKAQTPIKTDPAQIEEQKQEDSSPEQRIPENLRGSINNDSDLEGNSGLKLASYRGTQGGEWSGQDDQGLKLQILTTNNNLLKSFNDKQEEKKDESHSRSSSFAFEQIAAQFNNSLPGINRLS